MTRDFFTDTVRSFHETCDLPLDRPLTDETLMHQRLDILAEEVRELSEAALAVTKIPTAENQAAFLREMADVQYVLAGFAVSFGSPLAEAFQRVHEANLSRLVDGKPIKGPNNKITKRPNFRPPQLLDLVRTDAA